MQSLMCSVKGSPTNEAAHKSIFRSILPHAPYARPHVQLRVLAVVVRVSNRHARVRLDRVLHALFHAPFLIRDAVCFFHANQEGKRGFVAFFCLVGLIWQFIVIIIII